VNSVPVHFSFSVGLRRHPFSNLRLGIAWEEPASALDFTFFPMDEGIAEDGCPAFTATVPLDAQKAGTPLYWTVVGDGTLGKGTPLVTLEAGEPRSWDDWNHLYRVFVFQGAAASTWYRFCLARWLGANGMYSAGAEGEPSGIRFAVWAPHARQVDLVRVSVWDWTDPTRDLFRVPSVWERVCGGYVSDDGQGVEGEPFPMIREEQGVWSCSLAHTEGWQGRPYLFRVTREQGTIAFRTDLYSRSQLGEGSLNPRGRLYTGPLEALDGSVSASLVVDPDHIMDPGRPTCLWPEPREHFHSEEEFWQEEFCANSPLPSRLEELVIYELHVGALGFGREGAGTLDDAIRFLSHLTELGINAVELLPLSEFGGGPENWGYSTSHYFSIEYGGEGRDKFKQFVRECHRRGIAVLFDVVYNHYLPEGERAEWQYDSEEDAHNLYYWYEPGMGYVDNGSSGYAPRYSEELLRHMFISSALLLVQEFHVDGFRVDLTNAIHRDNVLHNPPQTPVPRANIYGARFLREWTRTLRTLRPGLFLIAEDHSGWEAVTDCLSPRGLGFDAVWYADFYHSLVGDAPRGPEIARLLWVAGQGTDVPLNLDQFASVLEATSPKRVVYHKNHDEAGNDPGTARTLVTAAGGAAYLSEPSLRYFAEARARWVAGMAFLSAGIPLFLFGEEVGATEPFLYGQVLPHREDLLGKKLGDGRFLFTFYRDLIRLRRRSAALQTGKLKVFYVHDANRVIGFRRWKEGEDLLILASLANRPYAQGYAIRSDFLPSGIWQEIFNSDSIWYGGQNVGNRGGLVASKEGSLLAVLPACGFVVLEKIGP
jgi:1,4-alpha-glucan branching enzyme